MTKAIDLASDYILFLGLGFFMGVAFAFAFLT